MGGKGKVVEKEGGWHVILYPGDMITIDCQEHVARQEGGNKEAET
jgi:hypothetical protein